MLICCTVRRRCRAIRVETVGIFVIARARPTTASFEFKPMCCSRARLLICTPLFFCLYLYNMDSSLIRGSVVFLTKNRAFKSNFCMWPRHTTIFGDKRKTTLFGLGIELVLSWKHTGAPPPSLMLRWRLLHASMAQSTWNCMSTVTRDLSCDARTYTTIDLNILQILCQQQIQN